ncbi:transcriptional regulator NrdR [Puniceicoccus vermicola]|uniref:Transcriptional repressor NrdR n=1 Tax=Puniceicoccus vermicola TaxID=388746 RepID=A0A7X1E3Z5_9BACT|nr:transcriptional regulator NrdR [Puniceicoccus vermicola]MBC2601458.1 transcriptional repressor NrdR [Puniceicoccus vermicola]
MRCPKCSSTETKVIDSRVGKSETSIRRRRECLSCEYRFTTIEEVLRENLRVIKMDQSREDFDRSKMLKGIRKAIEGRPVEMERIDMMIADIVDCLQKEFFDEIPSRAIGEEIMNRLKQIDQIAYVRFAIAYKDIRDIAELEQEISVLNQ